MGEAAKKKKKNHKKLRFQLPGSVWDGGSCCEAGGHEAAVRRAQAEESLG